jgi:serine/threonine protein kinase
VAETLARLPRVLVVESDDVARASMTRALEAARFACESAMDAEEALYWAAGTPFDLIVMDLGSWGSSGPVLLARLRAMTMERGTGTLALGADGEPPADAARLVREVEQVLRPQATAQTVAMPPVTATVRPAAATAEVAPPTEITLPAIGAAAEPAPPRGELVLDSCLSEPRRVTAYAARRVTDGGSEPVRLAVVEREGVKRPAELDALLQLRVPGIARLLSVGELADGRTYYESEHPEGPLLEDEVEAKGALPIDVALGLAEAMLVALGRARSLIGAHGGIHARRVVLSANGPVLLDHGIARLSHPEEEAALRAAAPEVWAGAVADPVSDLYSVGVVLFLALTGRYPFQDENPFVVGQNHVHTPPPTLAAAGLAAAPPELEAAIALLLAKEKTARYASAEVARAALEAVRLRDRAQKSGESGVPAPAGYRFIRPLGKGGSGEVFLALHETLDRVVAIKVIRPVLAEAEEVRGRFLREARTAASLVHPDVVQIFDAREEGGRLYLIMEFVDGEALRARLERDGPIPEPETIAIARNVLEAMTAAHELGIVHRDLKPDNLLLSRTGRIKVTDFGLATSLRGGQADHITQHGVVLGTPLYMSPEQCLAQATDERSDLYSFGATLYHMVAGRPPFLSESLVGVMRGHVSDPLPRLAEVAPHVSAELAGVIERLLAKDPAERFATARDVLAALFVASLSEPRG